MSRTRALILECDARAVLQELGRLGVLQLTRTVAGPETAPLPPHDCHVELATCERLLARVTALRQSLELPTPADGLIPKGMTLACAEDTLRSLGEQVDVLLTRRQGLSQELGESTASCERVAPYCGFGLPLELSHEPSFLHFATGSLPPQNLPKLQREISDNVALLLLPQLADRIPLIAMTTCQGRIALESALQKTEFRAEALPSGEDVTVDSFLLRKQCQRKEVASELEKVNAEVHLLAANIAGKLAQIEGLANSESRLLEAAQNFPRTAGAVLLSGWIPTDRAPGLAEGLRSVTAGCCVIETTAPDSSSSEQIPVLLRQPRVFRPFQRLVTAYSLPNYHELDPTLFVAISHVLMFGMMFGDLGHGAMLAIGGLLAFFAGRTETLRGIGVLLLLAAFSSMAFGIAYGSCFGLPFFKQFALWQDPLEGDPMGLMSGAIGIGIVMISLGLILNILNRFQRGDIVGGFLDKFGVVGLMFYWGTLALIMKFTAIQARGLIAFAVVLFVAMPLAGWVLKQPLEFLMHRRDGMPLAPGDSFSAAILESLVGAFEAVLSYLANTISFVRLAAYAMSHAALLVATFMLADAVRDVSPGGGLLSVLVIILGNLVAIVLEGIVASVQALRLEYYEFFGKFFSGGGRPFTPFRLAVNGLNTGGEL